jgi:quercetin dioxygenase-like cupin family protein
VITSNIDRLELLEATSDADPLVRVRFQFPLHAAAGTDATAAVYFELEPGARLARHTDSAEEVLYVVDGEGVAIVGNEQAELGKGALAVVPALVPHEVAATGDRTLRVLGIFAAAEVEHVFDEPVQPIGQRVLTTPAAA